MSWWNSNAMSLSKYLTFLLLSGFCLNANASTCAQLAVTINQDLKRSDIIQHPPAWMNITWLQKHLGPAQKTTNNERLTYKWVCPEEDSSYLSVVVDTKGKLIRVSGIYNDDNGNGMFGAVLNVTNTPKASPQNSNQIVPNSIQANQISIPNLQFNVASTLNPQGNQPASPNTSQTSTTATSNACNAVSSLIAADSAQFKTTLSNQQLPWMQVNWLTQKLGNPVVTKVNQSYYQWDQFKYFDDGLGSNLTYGTLPNNFHFSMFDNDKPGTLIKLLGQPKQVQNEVLTQYKWQCDKSSISLYLDANNTALSVITNSCSDGECRSNQQIIQPSKLNQAFMQVANQGLKQDLQKATADMITDFNTHFNAQLTTQDQLYAAMGDKLKAYYASVRQCIPGSYTYAKLLVIKLTYPVSVISGMQNGKCVVETNFTVEKDTINSKCQFSPQTMALFTDQQAVTDAQGDNMDAMHVAKEAECQTSIK